MKFNLVIGNPPYNRGIYMKFMSFAKDLASDYSCLIVPAKWHCKTDLESIRFNADFLKHIKKLVYYVDCKDVFDIDLQGGIVYYLASKSETETTEVSNISLKRPGLNSIEDRKLTACTLFNNLGNSILQRIKRNERHQGYKDLNVGNTYGVYTCTSYCHGGVLLTSGNTLVTNKMHIKDNSTTEVKKFEACLYTSDSIEECKSFISFMDSKLVRFIIFCLISGQQVDFENAWRYIPLPVHFDHIYTDKELYNVYEITEEEQKLINSLIKDR